jgi:hypothetical protein
MSFGFGTRFPRFSTGGAAAPFTPADLFSAGQKGVWYDFTDPAYVFQNTAGTIPVTDSTIALRVNDRSGNGNNWISTAGGQSAYYLTAASTNLKPSTLFQGGGNPSYGVTSAVVDYGGATAVTILCAYEYINTGVAGTLISSSQAVTSTNGAFCIRSPIGTSNNIEAAVRQNLGTATAGYTMNLSASETLVFCSVINNGGANKAAKLTTVTGQSPSFIKNNTTVPAASLTSSGAATTTGTGSPITNQVLIVGAENTTTNPGFNACTVYMYGIIIRAGILTPTEITNASAWLNAKCNAY